MRCAQSCKEEGMRIALLGGSFNPPHQAHVAICAWLLNNDLADRVWAIPCFEHPFNKELADFEDRLRMTRLAFEQFGERVVVSDVERELGGVSYTVRTVAHLKSRYPDDEFSFVMGGDVSGESGMWRDFGKIEEMVSLITIPRGEGSHVPDISATEIRGRVEAGQSIDGLVPPNVEVYIVSHRLYRSPKAGEEAE
jgi:nicotinate-nucleotide adenylyltransferase